MKTQLSLINLLKTQEKDIYIFNLDENGELSFKNSPYQFIDHICSEHPFKCSIKTCYVEVYYCNISWSWKIKNGSEKTVSVKHLITEPSVNAPCF